jgi:hypothetical protein
MLLANSDLDRWLGTGNLHTFVPRKIWFWLHTFGLLGFVSLVSPILIPLDQDGLTVHINYC